MKKRFISGLLCCSFALTGLFTGCSNGANSKKEIDKDQYLNVVLGKEPKTLDIAKASDLYSRQVLSQICEGLTRLEVDKDGKDVIKPAGAEKWDVSEDGTKWTFHLRDYEWSDGQKVTAKDYEYGIKRILTPKSGSVGAQWLYPIKNAEEFNKGKVAVDTVGVKAVDDKTLEVVLKAPCAYFLKTTNSREMMPQRKDLVEKNKEKLGTEADTMVYCGPFVLKEWKHGSKMELVKNEKYWDNKSVKLNKVTMKIIEDENAKMNELSNGSLDVSRVTKKEWREKLGKDEKFDSIKVPGSFTRYEAFNHKDKLFSNAKVRKAFATAVDREEAVKAVYPMFTPAYGWVQPSLQIGEKEFRKEVGTEPLKKVKEENQDPKKLLIEGLKELGMDQDPSKITIQYLQGAKDSDAKEIAEYFQQRYQKVLGVNVKVELLQWPVFMKKINAGEFQMTSLGWQGDYNDPMTDFYLWMTGANEVLIGWSNAKYDELVKKASSLNEKQNTERVKLFKDAENTLLAEDTAISPIAYGAKEMYKPKYVKGVMAPMFGAELDLKYAYTEGRPEKK